MRPAKLDEAIVGETIELVSAIEPDGVGQGRHRGSVWKVHNAGTGALEAGARCRVEEVNGITLTVGRSSDVLGEIDQWS
jgi:membrane protein implicated in regulation of membrane protease activity